MTNARRELIESAVFLAFLGAIFARQEMISGFSLKVYWCAPVLGLRIEKKVVVGSLSRRCEKVQLLVVRNLGG